MGSTAESLVPPAETGCFLLNDSSRAGDAVERAIIGAEGGKVNVGPVTAIGRGSGTKARFTASNLSMDSIANFNRLYMIRSSFVVRALAYLSTNAPTTLVYLRKAST